MARTSLSPINLQKLLSLQQMNCGPVRSDYCDGNVPAIRWNVISNPTVEIALQLLFAHFGDLPYGTHSTSRSLA
jgi:hypothetical protein